MDKVVIVISDISKKGGTERAAINLANLIVSHYNVVILSIHNVDNKIETFFELDSRVKLESLQLTNSRTIVNLKNNYLGLRSFFSSNNFDFILGFWFGVSILLPFFKKKKSKVIACEHGDFNANSKLVQLGMKLLYPRLDGLVVLSELAKCKMKKLNSNVIVIPNSLPFVVNNQVSVKEKRILMVGRLVDIKGYERIFPLASYLQKFHGDWRIDIYGDGPLREKLLIDLKNEKICNVNIFESVRSIKDEYLKSSIYLSTSHNEAMPMVFIEAMSCGLPIVSYSNEGALSLLSDKGIIVRNSVELIEAISNLINSEDLRKIYSEFGKEISNNYSIDNIKKKWNKYLSNF